MPDDQAQQILAPVQADNSVKADAWQGFKDSANEREYGAKLQNLNLPQDIKAQLWEAKRAAGAMPAQPAVGTGEQFIQQNQMSPFNRQANEFLLGGASGMSGLPETQSPVTDAVKGMARPPSLKEDWPSMVFGPAAGIAQSLYKAGKEVLSPQQAGESPEDAAARRAHGLGTATGTVAPAVIGEGVAKTKNAIPSTARAGQALEQVRSAAGDVPINTAKVGDTALELFEQSQRGANLPKAVRQLVLRMANPDLPNKPNPPLTYEEAKDFQSNISSLSVNERNALKPNTLRLVGKLNQDLKDSLANAADVQGQGEKFTQAMQEYRNAMKLKGYTDAAIKAALAGAGLYELKRFIGGR